MLFSWCCGTFPSLTFVVGGAASWMGGCHHLTSSLLAVLWFKLSHGNGHRYPWGVLAPFRDGSRPTVSIVLRMNVLLLQPWDLPFSPNGFLGFLVNE